MSVKRGLHQLSLTELFLEREKRYTSYDLDKITQEISDRNPSEEEIARVFKTKEAIQKLRIQRSTESLETSEKIRLILFPIEFSPREDQGGPSIGAWESEGGFLRSAGYNKKAKQRLKFKAIGTFIWLLVSFLLLYFW